MNVPNMSKTANTRIEWWLSREGEDDVGFVIDGYVVLGRDRSYDTDDVDVIDVWQIVGEEYVPYDLTLFTDDEFDKIHYALVTQREDDLDDDAYDVDDDLDDEREEDDTYWDSGFNADDYNDDLVFDPKDYE